MAAPFPLNEYHYMITVLFATQTGNAEYCAIDLVKALQAQGHTCKLENVYHYKAARLAEESLVLLVASTFGEGEPPDDAVPFFEDLKTLGAGSLPNLRYSVFALGDVDYELFCGFARDCDRLLEEAGAARLLPCEECNMDHDARLPGWAARVAETLKKDAELVR